MTKSLSLLITICLFETPNFVITLVVGVIAATLEVITLSMLLSEKHTKRSMMFPDPSLEHGSPGMRAV